jgi:AcrR family transcriptional regulator
MTAVTERADAARNRRAILRAALELYETAADPAAVTMDDVAAAAAGVGKGTLFRRFGDRTDLLRAVYETRTDDLAQAIAPGCPPGVWPRRAAGRDEEG